MTEPFPAADAPTRPPDLPGNFKERYETLKRLQESLVDVVYQALGVRGGPSAGKHAVEAVRGLQERVRFTENFETQKHRLAAAEDQVTALRAALQALRDDCSKPNDFHQFGSASAGFALHWVSNRLDTLLSRVPEKEKTEDANG